MNTNLDQLAQLQSTDSVEKEQGYVEEVEILQNKELTYKKYELILKEILPLIQGNTDRIIYTQVMLALRLDGLIGSEFSDKDAEIVEIVKNSVLQSEEKIESALLSAERIISS